MPQAAGRFHPIADTLHEGNHFDKVLLKRASRSGATCGQPHAGGHPVAALLRGSVRCDRNVVERLCSQRALNCRTSAAFADPMRNRSSKNQLLVAPIQLRTEQPGNIEAVAVTCDYSKPTTK